MMNELRTEEEAKTERNRAKGKEEEEEEEEEEEQQWQQNLRGRELIYYRVFFSRSSSAVWWPLSTASAPPLHGFAVLFAKEFRTMSRAGPFSLGMVPFLRFDRVLHGFYWNYFFLLGFTRFQ